MNRTTGHGAASRGSTRVRRKKTLMKEGVPILGSGGVREGEGFEARLLETIKASPDVSLRSDTLAADATTWRERLELDPARTNILRAFDLPPDARVLEVGAGCGVVTRFLGELGATVDAVEAALPKARVTLERCRDLPGVKVFAGRIVDVPAHAEYDLVIVTNLADHASTGTDGLSDFFQACADRLSPSGSLIVATSNIVGVRYLLGARDANAASDTSSAGRPGDSPGALSRLELEALLERNGLTPRTFAVFPDHRFARMVASPSSFPEGLRHLLYRIPDFPSPGPGGARPQSAREGRIWEALVEAGLATDTANGLLVLAGKGQESPLWPKDRAASYFSVGRRPLWSTATHVRISGDSAQFDCERLYPGVDEPPIRLRGYSEPARLGTDLVTFCLDAEEDEVGTALRGWADMLDARESDDGEIPLDLVPHNIVLQPDGTLAVFDEEWMADPGSFIDFKHVRRRGVLWLAVRVCRHPTRGRPRPQATARDLALHYGTMVGLDDGTWLDRTLDIEARLQARVHPRPPKLSEKEWERRFRQMLATAIEAPASASESDLDFDDLTQLRQNLGSLQPRLLGPGLSPHNDDLALLVGFRAYSRLARFFLPAGSRRNRLSNRIARRLLRLK